ncbi:helix-turn-helix domain-containing protein [Citrobacter sp. Cb010]|uniref:hypothetical protein n=1 Tax=unclassified Citrobacter TaxID=2644389 RepID=UPI0015E4B8ED|nr:MULTISPECIES: hypothetical protein [unclassified Citrobacter]MBA8328705.1 hypothetical protein [Citrobacter freundii]MBA8332811.1 hypothetical protein [Citrobacter freundii]MDM3376221.1 helix-turn-helix domain-containing protein [Citrobacter sp. Cb010]MDM3459434.1 helix-turn-helix domain-containing protein [Citrobacter sp. Cb036]QLM87090.1 hypothetical protein HVX13_15025 [Citrobacter freundii]
MTAATVSKPFTAITHELADIENINGKAFTMNMVYTYSLIKSFQDNGQIAYFSHSLLQTRLGAGRSTVIRMLREMVEMGLINKSEQVNGGTLNYTVNQITEEMIGDTPQEAQKEAPQAHTEPQPAPTPATPLPIQPTTTEEAHSEQRTDQPGITECGYSPDLRNSTSECKHVDVVHSGYGVCTPDTDRGLTLEEIDLSTIPTYDFDPVDADQYGDAF